MDKIHYSLIAVTIILLAISLYLLNHSMNENENCSKLYKSGRDLVMDGVVPGFFITSKGGNEHITFSEGQQLGIQKHFGNNNLVLMSQSVAGALISTLERKFISVKKDGTIVFTNKFISLDTDLATLVINKNNNLIARFKNGIYYYSRNGWISDSDSDAEFLILSRKIHVEYEVMNIGDVVFPGQTEWIGDI